MAQLYLNQRLIAQNINALIFDKDGTLIDAHHYWVSMIERRSIQLAKFFNISDAAFSDFKNKLMDAMGVDLKLQRLKPHGPVGVKPRAFIVQTVKDTLATLGIESDSTLIDSQFKVVDDQTQTNMAPLLKLLPGVPKLLEDSKQQGIKMAIATTDKTHRAELALEALGISHFFDAIVGADLVSQPKPNAESGIKILNMLGVSPIEAAMVGDHPVDIELGHNSQMACSIGVATGLTARDGFKDCFVVDTLEELEVRP